MQYLLSCLFLLVVAVFANNTSQPFNQTLWNNIVSKYVELDGELDGIKLHTVNYIGINNDPDFWAYLKQLETANADNLPKDEFYAFFINVYNALAVKTMIKDACKTDLFGKCGTIASIRDAGTILPWHPVWDKKAGIVGGKEWTLQQVEDLLRDPKRFPEDSRLHSAIVCASISCPNLMNFAFEVDKIDMQLNFSFNNWMNNTKKGLAVNKEKNQVTLSHIFNWFSGDFERGDDKTQLDFILQYLEPSNPNYDWLHQHRNDVHLTFFGYNWNSNADSQGLPCNASNRPCYPLYALVATLLGLCLCGTCTAVTVYCVRRRSRRSLYTRINS